MKLWLDDLRPAPLGWTPAKTVGEAVALLKTGEVDEASLDHDVIWDADGDATADDDWERRRTGLAVVLWMEQNNSWPKLGVAIHSSNAEGRLRMYLILSKYGKFNKRRTDE